MGEAKRRKLAGETTPKTVKKKAPNRKQVFGMVGMGNGGAMALIASILANGKYPELPSMRDHSS